MRKDGQEKGRKLRDVPASVKTGEHVVLHDAYLDRSHVTFKITIKLFVARYQLYLPMKEVLQAQLDKVLNETEE